MKNKLIKEMEAAIAKGAVTKVRALLSENDGLIDEVTVFGTWLHIAADAGKLEVVKVLIELGADVDVNAGITGGAALDEAASEGHLDVVKYLIEIGAEMDVSDPAKNPLFSAIYGNHLPVVKVLVEKGIDYKIKYTGQVMKNMDALKFAKTWGRIKIAKYLASLDGRLPS